MLYFLTLASLQSASSPLTTGRFTAMLDTIIATAIAIARTMNMIMITDMGEVGRKIPRGTLCFMVRLKAMTEFYEFARLTLCSFF